MAGSRGLRATLLVFGMVERQILFFFFHLGMMPYLNLPRRRRGHEGVGRGLPMHKTLDISTKKIKKKLDISKEKNKEKRKLSNIWNFRHFSGNLPGIREGFGKGTEW